MKNDKNGKETKEEIEGNSAGSAEEGRQSIRKYRRRENDGWNRQKENCG